MIEDEKDDDEKALRLEDIEPLLRHPIAFHPIFVKISGSVTAGLMLSQLWYWKDRTKDPERWLYKSHQEWEQEIGLSRREQDTARKKLRDAGLIEERLAKMPARVHFRVKETAVLSAVYAQLGEMRQTRKSVRSNGPNKVGGIRQASQAESAEQAGRNGPNSTENNQETSQDTTAIRAALLECCNINLDLQLPEDRLGVEKAVIIAVENLRKRHPNKQAELMASAIRAFRLWWCDKLDSSGMQFSPPTIKVVLRHWQNFLNFIKTECDGHLPTEGFFQQQKRNRR
ncbi:MAG TPA: hypothetical protein VJ464_24650 [Blastocatellia bacterium]|nr:hypothetical protein [Blastocatellia bacterium]